MGLLAFLLAAMTGCVTPQNQMTRSVCSAFCSYKSSSGAYRRVWLSQVGNDSKISWNQLEQACQEITCSKCSYELLVSVATEDAAGQKDYSMRPATMKDDCVEAIFSK